MASTLIRQLGAPFILDDPINGLAISLLFGILVSTLLTLVVIPVLYYTVNQRRRARSSSHLERLTPGRPASP